MGSFFLRSWNASGVMGPHEHLAAAAAYLRKTQLEALGHRVVITDERGHVVVPVNPDTLSRWNS